MLPGTTSICLLSFVCVSFFFFHAFRWSTTNHNSLTFFTTSTGRSLLLSCLEGRIFSQSIMPQPRRLYINQYGSNLDPRTMEQGDFMDIELSSSISDLVYETSHSASRAHSNSSASEASTGVRNELSSSSPLLWSEFDDISRFFQGKIEEIGADLPSNWSPEEFTRMVIGEEEVRHPSYLSDVYSNLDECGFHSCYWEQA